jgi:hypothetical protein
MEQLKRIAQEAMEGINAVLDTPLREEQSDAVGKIVEQAVIKALLEGQHRAVDACLELPEEEQDKAHKLRITIRQSNDALIANLTSLR